MSAVRWPAAVAVSLLVGLAGLGFFAYQRYQLLGSLRASHGVAGFGADEAPREEDLVRGLTAAVLPEATGALRAAPAGAGGSLPDPVAGGGDREACCIRNDGRPSRCRREHCGGHGGCAANPDCRDAAVCLSAVAREPLPAPARAPRPKTTVRLQRRRSGAVAAVPPTHSRVRTSTVTRSLSRTALVDEQPLAIVRSPAYPAAPRPVAPVPPVVTAPPLATAGLPAGAEPLPAWPPFDSVAADALPVEAAGPVQPLLTDSPVELARGIEPTGVYDAIGGPLVADGSLGGAAPVGLGVAEAGGASLAWVLPAVGAGAALITAAVLLDSDGRGGAPIQVGPVPGPTPTPTPTPVPVVPEPGTWLAGAAAVWLLWRRRS